MAVHTIAHTSLAEGGRTITSKLRVKGEVASRILEAVPDGTTVELAGGEFVNADALKSICIVSNVDVLLKTNSVDKPGDLIALQASQPLLWNAEDGYFPNPLTEDVTAWFVINNSGHIANIDIALLAGKAESELE